MSKISSAILLTVLAVIILFFGVFACIPTFSYGEYGEYYSPLSLIQCSNAFANNVKAEYSVSLDEDADFGVVKNQILYRLAHAYGYYGCSVSYDEAANKAVVIVPETAGTIKNADGIKTNNTGKTSADSILSAITVTGKLEISNVNASSSSSSTDYSASSMILKQEHYKSTSIRRYVNGDNVYHIVEVNLNAEGKSAASSLSTSTPYIVYVDESATTYCYKQSDSVMYVYTSSDSAAKLYASFINKGYIQGELTLNKTDDFVTSNDCVNYGGLIFLCVFAALVVAFWVVCLVKYKALGIAAIYSQLTVLVVFVIFAGYVGMQIFNIAAAIGLLISYALMAFFTILTFNKIREYCLTKTYNASKYKGFLETNKLNIIVHAAAVVLGVVLWLIPSIVTAPFGNVLLYGAVLSFVATMGLNRLFAAIVAPLVSDVYSKKAGK